MDVMQLAKRAAQRRHCHLRGRLVQDLTKARTELAAAGAHQQNADGVFPHHSGTKLRSAAHLASLLRSLR